MEAVTDSVNKFLGISTVMSFGMSACLLFGTSVLASSDVNRVVYEQYMTGLDYLSKDESIDSLGYVYLNGDRFGIKQDVDKGVELIFKVA